MRSFIPPGFILISFLFHFISSPSSAQDAKKPGNPVDHLPSYVKCVSGFGERPEWSHDSKKILFVSKPMGEAYELDLESGLSYPKTRHFNHFGFTRAMYLSNGDILLSGPVAPFDPTDKAERDYARDKCWLSVMDQSSRNEPVPLDVICAEGPAISRSQLKIAWAERDRQIPELGKNRAQLFVADIVYESGRPKVVNRKMVFDSKWLPFSLGHSTLEVQNFVPTGDSLLTFTVYQIHDGNNTDTYVINLNTGKYRNITRSPGYYDEAEGVFPDGKYTCVEHASSAKTAWPLLDLYKLKLDGSGEMQRLTYFSDYGGFKATQGVVSDDGKYLSFQMGKSGQEAGVGYGFFIMDLEQAAPHFEPFRSYAEEGF